MLSEISGRNQGKVMVLLVHLIVTVRWRMGSFYSGVGRILGGILLIIRLYTFGPIHGVKASTLGVFSFHFTRTVHSSHGAKASSSRRTSSLHPPILSSSSQHLFLWMVDTGISFLASQGCFIVQRSIASEITHTSQFPVEANDQCTVLRRLSRCESE